MSKWVRWPVIGLSFVWMAFVYATFYLVQQQRPFNAEQAQAIGETLFNLAAAAAIIGVGIGWGNRLSRWLRLPLPGLLERLVLGGGLGLGSMSWAVLGLGLAGWLHGWVMAILLIGLAALSLPDLIDLVRQIRTAWPQIERPGRWIGLYVGLTALLSLLIALTPPFDWDGLFYHLTMPRLYIEQGRIMPITDAPHQYFPGLIEMLYLLALQVRSDVTARLLHWGYAVLLGGTLYLLAGRYVDRKYGWPTVLLYAAIPMVAVLGSWAYNDLALAFYQLAALYALLNWFRNNRFTWVIWSGILCGLALSLKYTAFVCPLILLVLMAWQWRREGGYGPTWLRAAAVFGAVTILTAAPWYVKNLVLTGNPVYPFAFGLFGGRDWDAWRAAWYARAGTGIGWSVGELLQLPWMATLGLRDMNFYDGRMGPLFLLGLPFLLGWAAIQWPWLRRPLSRVDVDTVRSQSDPIQSPPIALGYLLAFSAIQCAVWTIGVINSRSLYQTRLLLPALAGLTVPLVYVFDRLRALDTPVLSLRRLIGMSVVLVLATDLGYQSLATIKSNPLQVLVGLESREQFLARALGAHYAAMQMIDAQVSRTERVLFLWEPRSYYCHRTVQPDPILERWAWLRHRYGDDLTAVARFLQSEGYTHILLHRDGLEFMRRTRLDPLSDADFAALDHFVQQYAQPIDAVGLSYQLYQLEAGR